MEDIPKTTISPVLDTQELHHNGRIVKVHDRFIFLGEVVSDERDFDPSSYNEVIFDKHLRIWKNAMKVEMESMYSNHIWKLIEPLINVKSIDYKWVYKRKRGLDGLIETFKARLVAK